MRIKTEQTILQTFDYHCFYHTYSFIDARHGALDPMLVRLALFDLFERQCVCSGCHDHVLPHNLFVGVLFRQRIDSGSLILVLDRLDQS